MNTEQLNAATESMTEWLAHPAELGKAPARIECAGEFDLHELHYYIFKYKKSTIGKWLLGVCGGYEGDELEHCGHVFSEMEEYNEETALEQATALVEYVREYYMNLAKEAEERKENAGTFINYVLLSEAKWDKDALLRDLKETWGIEDEAPEDSEDDEGDDTFVISYQGAMIAFSLMPAPIPDGEAEYAVANNFMWKDGVEQVKQHKAHILIAQLGKELSPTESGEILVKAVVSACKQEGVLGIYTGDVVLEPRYYLTFAKKINEDAYPITNLVWVGLHKNEKGLCGYTAGMRNFGYDEMEVLNSSAEPDELLDFLTSIANYVVLEDVILQDGETIGFSADQEFAITKSKGVAVEGDSLKIEYGDRFETDDEYTNREELLQQINKWYENDEYQKIIDAIEALPQEEWGYELTCFLALGYNNVSSPEPCEWQLEKAVSLLESVREDGKDDSRWHFRLGYALYYLDREAEALPCFRRAAELGDPDTQYFIEQCEKALASKVVTDSEESSFYITLNLNARLQPTHRGDLEDALDELLEAAEIGFVDGGGTLMSPSGEVKSCDIELNLNDGSEETIAKFQGIIESIGVPKGSKLLWIGADDETIERPVGSLEGMALYLNGTDLPDEVYESSDINYAIEQLEARMDGIGRLYSWWEGPQNTALYFYGQSYDKMLAAVQDFIAEYPLCQKSVVERIA